MSGKGDRYRPVNVEAYKANHDRIFKTGERRETSSKSGAETVARCPHTVDIEALISDSGKAKGDG